MNLERFYYAVVILWPLSEAALAMTRRAKLPEARLQDRGTTWKLWLIILAGIGAGLALQSRRFGRIGLAPTVVVPLGLALILLGLAIRWAAILVLGGSFTVNVSVAPGQRVIRRGPYRYVRHPSYTGSLLAFLGLGVSLGNWVGLVALFLPILAGFLYRIRVEERALVESLGEEYLEYRRATKRLLPGLY